MKRQRAAACDSRPSINVDRRTFIGTMACAGAGMSFDALAQPPPPAAAPVQAQRATITLHVNGVAHELALEPRVTLLDARGNPRAHERQHLPLRRLPEYRRGDPPRVGQDRLGQGSKR